MANENLKNALRNAGLTPEEFADVVRVDPKSVQRWVNGNTIPYPRHRKAIARALDLGEQQLWPGQTATQPSDGVGAVEQPDGGCDVVGTWGHANDPTAPDLVSFITNTAGPIDVLDPYPGIEMPAGFVDALAAQATIGRHIRILSCEPLPEFASLAGRHGIEILDHQMDLESWLIQTGERMLLSINLHDGPAVFESPLIELTGTVEGGLFDRLRDKFDALWELAQEHDAYHEQPSGTLQADGSQRESHQHDNPSPAGLSPTDQPKAPTAEILAGQPPSAEPRRWPRRPYLTFSAAPGGFAPTDDCVKFTRHDRTLVTTPRYRYWHGAAGHRTPLLTRVEQPFPDFPGGGAAGPCSQGPSPR